MADLPISGLPAITVPSNSYLLAAVSASVTSQMTVAQVAAAISSSFTSSQAISSSYTSTASYYNEVDPVFVAKSSSLATTGSNIFVGNQTITGSLTVTGSNSTFNGPNTTVSGAFYIASSSLFNENTASAIVSYDTASGQFYHTTYQSVLPALFAAGAFYSTGSITTTPNQSGSFTFTTSLGINTVTLISGSQIHVDRTATYNFQFSIQISQGSQAAELAVWLKKNGTNVADTATYLTTPSNDTSFLALNLWDSATAGDYYELAYQSDRNDTQFITLPASGNIPRSPSVILTVNQVR